VSRRYGLHGRGTGVQFTVKAEKFVLSTAPRMLEMDAMGSLPGVKAVGHEADHSLLSKAEVKMRGAIPLVRDTPSCCGASYTNRNVRCMWHRIAV
jgi:hypothetical protein